MTITIKDLARLAGVSPSTVSRALADSPLSNAETKARIQRLARELGYSPNGLARGLVKRRSTLLGLLVPDIANPFFSEWAQVAEREAARRGYAVILANTMRVREQEDVKIRSLLEMRVAAFLVCSLDVRNPTVSGLARQNVPTVFCDVDVPGVEHAYLVHGKDAEGAELATRHLVSLGRRTIGHLAGTHETLVTDRRLRGYQRGLRAAGLTWDLRQVVHGEYSERGGFDATRRLLANLPELDAVFAANDLMAIGALEALTQAGRRVPQDVSVVGYDDIRLASLVRPRLTTVRQSARTLGEQGMRLLLEALDGASKPRVHEIAPHLVVRESCGATPRKEEAPEAEPVPTRGT